MIIEPKTRGFLCLTSHPAGCQQNVLNQIDYVKKIGKTEGPKNVLVIGSSTGFGLASRITSAYAHGASTIGICYEKAPTPGKTATPGWYNTAAFEIQAHKDGLYAKTINGDAFSDEIKEKTLKLIKEDLGTIDLIIYSVASPMRIHPKTGVRHKSVLKPLGDPYKNKTIDIHTGAIYPVEIPTCNKEEIENTIAVMGGEDWKMWIDALAEAGLLAENFKTVSYSYTGPEMTKPIYRNGTIGQAKDHLEATAHELTKQYSSMNGKAYVSVNKALVTQASSAIPVIPLYILLLFKTMKEKGIHEGCIQQIQRLYADRLFKDEVPTDEEGRIRVDDWEMREDVQQYIIDVWQDVATDNLNIIGDLKGYQDDFMNLFGFNIEGVDYSADTDEMMQIPGLV